MLPLSAGTIIHDELRWWPTGNTEHLITGSFVFESIVFPHVHTCRHDVVSCSASSLRDLSLASCVSRLSWASWAASLSCCACISNSLSSALTASSAACAPASSSFSKALSPRTSSSSALAMTAASPLPDTGDAPSFKLAINLSLDCRKQQQCWPECCFMTPSLSKLFSWSALKDIQLYLTSYTSDARPMCTQSGHYIWPF